MNYLEYLQIKSSVDQEKQKDRLQGLMYGIASIIISLALYISLDWIILPTMILVLGFFNTILAYTWNFVYNNRINKLKELYKEEVDANNAAEQVFSIKEIAITLN